MSTAIRDAVAALVSRPIPAIGSGRTDNRWLSLFNWSRTGSVSIARLAEAHVDAVAILREAVHQVAPGALYAVWASQSPNTDGLRITRNGSLSGSKGFCSGIGVADRALVTATDPDGADRLVEVSLSEAPTWSGDCSQWATAALADTKTGSVSFASHPIEAEIGPPGWYLDRPGFWHGAIGPAACWAGAAAGLVDHAERDTKPDPDPHSASALGALRAELHLLESLLRTAGHDIDSPANGPDDARRVAYAVRHLVERSTARIIDEFSRSQGPRPFVTTASVAQRLADTHLYTRQHHGDRDLHVLGTLSKRHADG